MSEPAVQDGPTMQSRAWQAIDWAARAIALAMHLCDAAGQADVARELGQLHLVMTRRRDRA
jgi:hypothetical protein